MASYVYVTDETADEDGGVENDEHRSDRLVLHRVVMVDESLVRQKPLLEDLLRLRCLIRRSVSASLVEVLYDRHRPSMDSETNLQELLIVVGVS